MAEEVVCPSCGRGNDISMAESYRVCVHCGGDLSAVVAGSSPMDDLQRTIDGQPPMGGQAAPPQQPPQPPPPADVVRAPYRPQGIEAGSA
ncbi:MAG: hypothetical protein KAQ96_01490 [Thermoplasmata archaeon]|nr:hypothetical protein [Thermoplasmata archaeon]